MKVTEEMLKRAEKAYDAAVDYEEQDMCATDPMRLALKAALADAPEPGAKAPGPFALTPREEECLTHDVDCPGCGSVFRQALDRACRTLGPQAVLGPTGDVLTAEEREVVDAFEAGYRLANADGIVDILKRIAPKPAPVEKTNEELAASIMGSHISVTHKEALDELVRRANQGAGK